MKCHCSNDAKPCGACRLHCGKDQCSYHPKSSSSSPSPSSSSLSSSKQSQAASGANGKGSKNNSESFTNSPVYTPTSAIVEPTPPPPVQPIRVVDTSPAVSTATLTVVYAKSSDVHQLEISNDAKIDPQEICTLAKRKWNIPKGNAAIYPNNTDWTMKDFKDHGCASPIVVITSEGSPTKSTAAKKITKPISVDAPNYFISYNELLAENEKLTKQTEILQSQIERQEKIIEQHSHMMDTRKQELSVIYNRLNFMLESHLLEFRRLKEESLLDRAEYLNMLNGYQNSPPMAEPIIEPNIMVPRESTPNEEEFQSATNAIQNFQLDS